MVNRNKLPSARWLFRIAAACAGLLLGASAFAESERGEGAIAGLAASGSNPGSGNLSYSVSMPLADARRTELSLPGQARWVVVRGGRGKRRDSQSAIPPGVVIDVVLRNERLLRLRGDGDGGVQTSTAPDRRIQYGAELQDPDTGAYVALDSERGALWVPGGTRGTGRGGDGPESDGEDWKWQPLLTSFWQFRMTTPDVGCPAEAQPDRFRLSPGLLPPWSRVAGCVAPGRSLRPSRTSARGAEAGRAWPSS